MIKVHGVPPSPFVRKLLLALEYKQLDFEINFVMGGSDDPDFRRISPLGKIPVLEHDGFTIPDTSIICRYLDRVFKGPPLYPEDPRLEAQACWLEELGDTRLMEACAALYMQRFVIPNLYKKPTDEDLVADALNKLPPLLDYLESVVPDSGPLVDDAISIADLTLATCFLTAQYGEYRVDTGTHPKLAAYLERTLGHDVVKARMANEAAVVEQLLAG